MAGGGSGGGSSGGGSSSSVGSRGRVGSSGGGGEDSSADSGSGHGSDQVSAAEKIVMVASVAFTVALFGFALWQALTGPGALAPTATVVSSQPVQDGGVQYTIELRNPGDVGLVSATVEAACTDPPAEIVFENVPADGRRSGTVVCPAGTDDPAVSVSSWVRG